MLLGTFDASLLRTFAAGRGINRAGKVRGINKKGGGIIRAGEEAIATRQGQGIVRTNYGNKNNKTYF